MRQITRFSAASVRHVPMQDWNCASGVRHRCHDKEVMLIAASELDTSAVVCVVRKVAACIWMVCDFMKVQQHSWHVCLFGNIFLTHHRYNQSATVARLGSILLSVSLHRMDHRASWQKAVIDAVISQAGFKASKLVLRLHQCPISHTKSSQCILALASVWRQWQSAQRSA